MAECCLASLRHVSAAVVTCGAVNQRLNRGHNTESILAEYNSQMLNPSNIPLHSIHDPPPPPAAAAEKNSLPLGNYSESCAFCAIAHAFPPSPALSPPAPSPNDDPTIFPQTHIIISTASVLAFLDIQPLSRGHVLVCPRDHVERVTDMTPSESGRIGAWLPVIARAVMKTAGVTDFNVVQNNGIHAAQVVPHVHYHIIPRPSNEERERLIRGEGARWLISKYGNGVRTDLDDEEGATVAGEIRDNVFSELQEMKRDGDGRVERKWLSSL